MLAFVIPFSGEDETTPSYHLQHHLHKPVAFLIVPIFALANTGIFLNDGWLSQMTTSNSLGIIAGLVLGKPAGILLASWVLIKFFKVNLPADARWINLVGAAILGGIGFTMSIFISNLAFADADVKSYAKVSVLIASLIATIFGLLVLFSTKPALQEEEEN